MPTRERAAAAGHTASTPASGSDGRSLDLEATARAAHAASSPEEEARLAGALNDALVALRGTAQAAESAARIRRLLESNVLDGLRDDRGRVCRKEAVETLVAMGFPHALEVSPEDLAWARPTGDAALARELQQQRRARVMSAVVAGASAVEGLVVLLGDLWPYHRGTWAALMVHALFGAVVVPGYLSRGDPTVEGSSGREARAWLWIRSSVFAVASFALAVSVSPLALIAGLAASAAAVATIASTLPPKPKL